MLINPLDLDLREDTIVVIKAFDDVPEHLFQVSEVFDDCITGTALTGPLEGAYGEPGLELILRIYHRR